MTAYSIGVQADQLIAIQFRLGGLLSLTVRRRAADGTMAAVPDRKYRDVRGIRAMDIAVGVEENSSGVIELVQPQPAIAAARTIIPLGIKRPFLASEMPPSPGADGSFSFSDRVAFHFENNDLTWRTENMSGRMALNQFHPELSVVLRLAAGNHGAVSFSPPLAVHADGRTESLVSVM